MDRPRDDTDVRTVEQLTQHYEVEKELASRLRNASRDERSRLYSSLYDEMFRRVPLHPLLTRKSSPADGAESVSYAMRFLRRFLSRDTRYLEIGPGDCTLAFAVAAIVKQVHAVDVSEEITKASNTPPNFNLIITDGCSILLPECSIDVAYSNQLMEHLHPDDAFVQLQNIYRVLAPGGLYICITPNRLTGPHDISLYFDTVATGFHMKEYTHSELSALFTQVGFSGVHKYVGIGEGYSRVPMLPVLTCEWLLSKAPGTLRNRLVRARLFSMLSMLLNIRLVGVK